MSEFKEFGKIARLNRDIVITEKLDGTNAQILFEPVPGDVGSRGGNVPVGDAYGVFAGSRNRWLQPGKGDNYGFGGWVAANADALFALLGPGRHFGEWWGAGIQRKYGLTAKRFSLFNVHRYGDVTAYTDPRCVSEVFGITHRIIKGQQVCQCREARAAVKAEIGGVLIEPVPVLYRGPWFTGHDTETPHVWAPTWALDKLRAEGSQAVPFMDPEGIVVFHEASGQLFKATIEGDEKPKGQLSTMGKRK